ncbi:MAG TPA: 6-carboxytetrahydropterin synthase, partial [Gammaproteobacteria bacterium]|nr:6-carboxytetrahydropterin synthase [Gammaproteobacteria bacterium]
MSRLAIVELHKNELHFSAGHFTIFSATERENLHGHNYELSAELHVLLPGNGLAFDYRVYKNKLIALCEQLDRRFLLPQQSKYLKLEEKDEMLYAHFNQERIPFLKRDVVTLPICNITIEELSHWFLLELIRDEVELRRHKIQG